jgi:two-component system NtrC family sensor kinase
MTTRREFLIALTSALEQVAEGDYSIRLDIGGEEEFEPVAAAFNAMQVRLRDTVSSLELAIKNLHQKQRELVEAEKLASLGRVAAGVAHEINNPLAVMNEKAGLLQDLLGLAVECPGKEEYLALVRGISIQVRRCGAITHTLLGYVRRVDLTVEPFDVNHCVREVAEDLEHLSREKGVTVGLELGVELPVVRSDKIQLEQVVLNLVKNAIEAVPPGGAVRVATAPGTEGTALITVSDDGPGISPAHLAHLFEPFFTTKEKGQGTGLGLFISRGIMKRLGGDLQVASTPGKGTVFTVAVPLRYGVLS